MTEGESGLVHTVISTGANVSDISQTAELLHGGETRVGADAGYNWCNQQTKETGEHAP